MRRLPLAVLCAAGCALGVPAAAPAIVGGHAPSRDYPAMAALELEGQFRCGASLVRPTWVLTAAHCVDGGAAAAASGNLTFVLGRPRRSDQSVGERIKAVKVIRHERYAQPASASNDVALVELERAAAPAPIRVVTVAQRDLWKPGTSATVIGWGGQTALGLDGGTDDLREVQVPIQTDSTCDRTYRNTLGYDPATMLCAGNGLGGKDSCQGDSGGPLMVIADGAPVLVGVVSFGLGCGLPTLYGVYARIGAPGLVDWINRNAGPVATRQAPASAPPRSPASAPALGLRRATRSGRAIRLALSVRRPVTALRITVSRIRGDRATTIARTSRTRASRSFTAALRLARTTRPGRLRVKVSARDAEGHSVGFTRMLRARG